MSAPKAVAQEIEALERFMRESIPQARAMQLRMRGYEGECLCLHAPLAPNANDKGCAFGGSLSGLMTLAGWALVVLALKTRSEDADVFVARSEVRYLEPLFDDLHVCAELAPDADWEAFLHTLEQRGKARVCVAGRVRGGNGPACTQLAHFVAKRRATAPDRAQ